MHPAFRLRLAEAQWQRQHNLLEELVFCESYFRTPDSVIAFENLPLTEQCQQIIRRLVGKGVIYPCTVEGMEGRECYACMPLATAYAADCRKYHPSNLPTIEIYRRVKKA